MATWQFQSAMNKGELDPLLLGRIDLQAYYNGLSKAENVLTIPQGGAKRRPGMEFIKALEFGGSRMERFAFGDNLEYLLVFVQFRLYIFKVDEFSVNQINNINGSGNDYLTLPFEIFPGNLNNDDSFDYIQSTNTAIITQGDLTPQRITRQSDTEWTIEDVPLTNIPQYDFNDDDSPVPVSEIQVATFNNYIEGDRYKISLEGFLTEEVVWAGDDEANAENIRIAIQDLRNTGNSGVLVSVLVNIVTITFSGDSANDWDLLTFTAFSTRSVDFAVTVAETQAGTTRKEDVWSFGRGFPRVCTFHEGRLWFGNTDSQPSTIWGSKVNFFFDFDEGRARDDEGIFATLDTDQLNSIRALYSNRSLQIFTTGAEFYVRESPITPSNIAVIPQTNMGSKRIRPVTIDGVTLFPQKSGKSINQFVFLNDIQSNASAPVSSLAAHLINDPIQMSVQRGSEASDANYVYILNVDGGITVFNTLVSEDVQAFSSWSTTDPIDSIAVVRGRLFTLVNRIIDGVDYLYVEGETKRYDDDGGINTDSMVQASVFGNDIITGLESLEGRVVDVKIDNNYAGQFTVTGGEIEYPGFDGTFIEVGIPYTPIIRTMPINTGLKNGPNASSKKKILRASIRRHESNGVIVNGQRLADRTIGVNQFDAPIPQSDLKRITLLGWSLEAYVTVTQDTPYDMTILSIGMEVKT